MKKYLSREFLRRLGERVLLLFLSAFVLFFLLDIIFPLKVKIPYSQQIVSSDRTLMSAFLSEDQKWRMYSEPDELSPEFRKIILYKEDKFFYYHYGINPIAIFRAAFNNIVYRKRTSGASTITMQLARLLYPKDRTYLNKISEMFRALQLEHTYSKDEILNLYLNLVPYGSNVEGVKAASLIYFGKKPDKLSLAQMTTLAIIPNRPGSLRPGRNTTAIVQARNKWLRRIQEDGIASASLVEDALTEPLEAKRNELPRMAPHISIRLHQLFPQKPVIHTTINLSHQQTLLGIAKSYTQRLSVYGIYNCAVLVINNKTHTIESYIGSPDFNDMLHAGQVDGIQAIRSPGSTLKPLVYSIAFDDGLLTPKSVIADVPVNYAGYSPENYNSKYNGNVTVEFALSNSLNIPAVKTLNMVGLESLIDKMREAGFGQAVNSANTLGLSVVLGGCGVKLEEMTALYSAFASGGKLYHPSVLFPPDTLAKPVSLISPGAAFMTTDILTKIARPEMPADVVSSQMHIPKIAWKTGTSYGRRDAWSIGFNKDYTIGVWVGNFNGLGVPELSGAEMATPLLFKLFNSIDYNSSNEWFHAPDDVDFRLVCSESGKVPEEFCQHRIIDYFIPKVSTNVRCDHMKKVFISPDSSISYCTACIPDNGYKIVEYPNPEPDLVAFYEAEHIAYRKIPPHNPKCERVFEGKAPVITSLADKREYRLEKDEKNPGQLMLSCTVSNDVNRVFWYINNRFYKEAKAGEELFFTPDRGRIKISCSDDKGRNVNIEVTVLDL